MAVDIEGNATTTTNWGRKSIALVMISPAAYSPESWSGSTLRATMMSALPTRPMDTARRSALAATQRAIASEYESATSSR